MTWVSVPSIKTIEKRLPLIFVEGIEHRNYCIREASAKTVLAMFYCGAIGGTDRWIRPSQITALSNDQVAQTDQHARESWCAQMLSNQKKVRSPNAWYAVDSREQIRDECIAKGLIPNQAVVERPGVPTTSSKPTYALQPEFAALFGEALLGDKLTRAIEEWQSRFLSRTAMARATIIRKNAAPLKDRVQVMFPNGSATTLAHGESSVLTKAVVEQFAVNFLYQPAVLWLSESAKKVIDESLAKDLRLHIDPSKSLPDVILVDLSPASGDILFVFVEVVHTDGPVSQQRKESLRAIALDAGFSESSLAFVTAFADRGTSKYKSLVANLAWNSFVWFASEPGNIIALQSGAIKKLSELR